MISYRERIADVILQKKLRLKGAVLIQGAKWKDNHSQTEGEQYYRYD